MEMGGGQNKGGGVLEPPMVWRLTGVPNGNGGWGAQEVPDGNGGGGQKKGGGWSLININVDGGPKRKWGGGKKEEWVVGAPHDVAADGGHKWK